MISISVLCNWTTKWSTWANHQPWLLYSKLAVVNPNHKAFFYWFSTASWEMGSMGVWWWFQEGRKEVGPGHCGRGLDFHQRWDDLPATWHQHSKNLAKQHPYVYVCIIYILYIYTHSKSHAKWFCLKIGYPIPSSGLSSVSPLEFRHMGTPFFFGQTQVSYSWLLYLSA